MGHKQGHVTEPMELSRGERANRYLLHAFHEYRVLSKIPVDRSEYKLRFYILSTCQLIPPTTSSRGEECGGGGGGEL